MITWLIGKSDNVDLLWTETLNEIVSNIEEIKNINLFENKKYKYILNKKDYKFFTQNHENFNDVLIKGLTKIDEKILDINKDKIIYVDNLTKDQLFKYLLKIKNVNFEEKELIFIKKHIENLIDLKTLITLKELNIDQELWINFISKSKDNWYAKLKNNTLQKDCIINNNNIMVMMQYMINSKHTKKTNLLFIQAKIKEGSQLWELSNFWESIV